MLPAYRTHHLTHYALPTINATQRRARAPRPAPTPNAPTRLIGRIAAARHTPSHRSLS
jgi:hypothetical protein